MLVTEAYLFRLFGDAGANRLHLALSFSPFWFTCVGRLGFYFRIVLNLFKNQEKSPSIDWSRLLCQVVLGLPLGLTHAQQVRGKVGVIQGQYLLRGLICAWAVVQAW